MCGKTVAKIIDCRAGYEDIQNRMLGALSGAPSWYLNARMHFRDR